jgi:hypothetical protein
MTIFTVEKAEENAQRKREGDKEKNWQDVLVESVEVINFYYFFFR